MSLALSTSALQVIHAELVRAYPEEGCGVLLGREDEGRREVARSLGFDNRREDSRPTRYLIAPEDVAAAERLAREQHLDIIGFYHSHPDHPARPSAFDLEHAWPWYSYVIVSVLKGKPADTTAWRLAEDRSRFEPETIDVVTDAAPAVPGEPHS